MPCCSCAHPVRAIVRAARVRPITALIAHISRLLQSPMPVAKAVLPVLRIGSTFTLTMRPALKQLSSRVPCWEAQLFSRLQWMQAARSWR